MRERESGFVVALCFLLFRRLVAQSDCGDLDPGEFPAMADCPMIPFSATILEGDYLLVLALLDDLSRDGSALDQGAPVGYVVAVTQENRPVDER